MGPSPRREQGAGEKGRGGRKERPLSPARKKTLGAGLVALEELFQGELGTGKAEPTRLRCRASGLTPGAGRQLEVGSGFARLDLSWLQGNKAWRLSVVVQR